MTSSNNKLSCLLDSRLYSPFRATRNLSIAALYLETSIKNIHTKTELCIFVSIKKEEKRKKIMIHL